MFKPFFRIEGYDIFQSGTGIRTRIGHAKGKMRQCKIAVMFAMTGFVPDLCNRCTLGQYPNSRP